MRTAFFDLDGTLLDPQVGILACIRHALTTLNAPCPDAADLHQWIGPPLAEAFAHHLGPGPQVQRAVDLYRDRFATLGLYENEVYPAIPDLLATLQGQGWSLYVVTAKPRVFAEKIVAHFQLEQFFQGVYGSELDGTHARKGDLIAHVLQDLQMTAAAPVMVGDRHHDIHGAKQNGLAAIGVLWGYGSRQELLAAGADYLCDRPEDVGDYLLSSPSGGRCSSGLIP